MRRQLMGVTNQPAFDPHVFRLQVELQAESNPIQGAERSQFDCYAANRLEESGRLCKSVRATY
jgi:hypothetical protein